MPIPAASTAGASRSDFPSLQFVISKSPGSRRGFFNAACKRFYRDPRPAHGLPCVEYIETDRLLADAMSALSAKIMSGESRRFLRRNGEVVNFKHVFGIRPADGIFRASMVTMRKNWIRMRMYPHGSDDAFR
jgi:hypothetical protein